ncbi:MAG: hypothetical protein WKF86_00610 [Acidimicrobiales bacterium]
MATARPRHPTRVAVSVLLAGLLCVFGLAVTAQPAAAASQPPCPPNSTDPSVPALGQQRCVAELYRNVRSRLLAACLTAPKTAARTNPLYLSQECRSGSGVQAEAIAQARLLAWFNSIGAFGGPPAAGGIASNEQWEVTYPKAVSQETPPGSRRIDVMGYDPSDSTTDINLVELKQRTSGTSEFDANKQLRNYVRDFPAGSAQRQKQPYAFSAGYVDRYRVLFRDCTSPAVRFRIVNQYQVKASVNQGVLMIDMDPPNVTPCPRGGPPLPPVPAEEPTDVDIPESFDDRYDPPRPFPAPGRDADQDGKDDFWEKWLEEHPELE